MTTHPRTPTPASLACLLALAVLPAACIIDPAGAPYPVALEAISDTVFRVAPGTEGPLRVRVLSNEGRPMTVPAVEWTAEAGALTPRADREHHQGVYQTIWRAPTQAGSYRIQDSQPHVPPLRFRGEVTP